MMEARSRAARHADYVQAGRNYEPGTGDRLADRIEIMAGCEVAVQDAHLPPLPRCPRVLRYQVSPDLPVGPVGAAPAHIEVRDVETQCERTYGHAGNCVGRLPNGQSFAAPGSYA